MKAAGLTHGASTGIRVEGSAVAEAARRSRHNGRESGLQRLTRAGAESLEGAVADYSRRSTGTTPRRLPAAALGSEMARADTQARAAATPVLEPGRCPRRRVC